MNAYVSGVHTVSFVGITGILDLQVRTGGVVGGHELDAYGFVEFVDANTASGALINDRAVFQFPGFGGRHVRFMPAYRTASSMPSRVAAEPPPFAAPHVVEPPPRVVLPRQVLPLVPPTLVPKAPSHPPWVRLPQPQPQAPSAEQNLPLGLSCESLSRESVFLRFE